MLAAIVLLILIVAIGIIAAWLSYDVAATSSDPTQSALASIEWGPLIVAAVIIVLLFGLAIRFALEWRRPRVTVIGLLLILLVAAGVGAATYLGHEAKRVSASKAPECGGAETNAEFAAIKHPGYFGGGTSEARGCSYLLTTEDITASLTAYEAELRRVGYTVVRTENSLLGTREGFRFSVTVGDQGKDDGRSLTVILRKSA